MLDRKKHGPILELRLNRPPANALSTELIASLLEAVSRAPRDNSQAIVLSGVAGMFSGGLDVPYLLQQDRDTIRSTWQDFYALMRALGECPVPVVAAITGHSPAGGAVMSIFCDWRVMAEGKFKIGLNEVQVGLPMPRVIFSMLSRQLGARQAERLSVSAELIGPEEALRVGLVDELAPVNQVVERAVDRCNRLLALPPHAMLETRRLARGGIKSLFADSGKEVEALVERWFSDETQAAMRALVKRLAAPKS